MLLSPRPHIIFPCDFAALNRVDTTFKVTSEVLIAAKPALEVVPRVVEVAVVEVAPNIDGEEHSYAIRAALPSPALEVGIGDDDDDASMHVNLSSVEPKVSQPKKAKLSVELNEGMKEGRK